MSKLGYYTLLENNILTTEQMQHKDEIIRLTEAVFGVKGIKCDSKISQFSLEQLIEILEMRRKYKKNKQMIIKQSSSSYIEADAEKEIHYIQQGVYI